jgi:hypothetical protein
MKEEVGALARALKIFEVQYVNLNGNPISLFSRLMAVLLS